MEKRCSNGKIVFEGLFPLLHCGVVEVGFWQFWKNKKEKKALFAFRGCGLRLFKPSKNIFKESELMFSKYSIQFKMINSKKNLIEICKPINNNIFARK